MMTGQRPDVEANVMLPQVCVFDVNETLLDVGALDPLFQDISGSAETRIRWFDQVIQFALVTTITGAYADFGSIGLSALQSIAAQHDWTLTDAHRTALIEGMRSLPPHPDAQSSLERLRSAGVRLAALTNSPLASAEASLKQAGLYDYFESVLSADTVQRLKPAPESYRMAADRLGVVPTMIRLVAAHAWDIAGAMRVGCAGAFVARPGKVLNTLTPTPDIVGKDLHEVADQILERDRPSTRTCYPR